MIKFGEKTIQGLYYGDSVIEKIYFGNQLIYSAAKEKWQTPTLLQNNDNLSTDYVDGVTKYILYNGDQILGYFDEYNIWHPMYDYIQEGSIVTIKTAPYQQSGSEVTIL